MVSVKLADPQFEGQTKTKLGNAEVEGIVASRRQRGAAEYLEENPEEAKRIIEKASQPPGPRGRPQGARADAAQGRARAARPARQAGRLHRAATPRARAVPRRGRLRRRLGQAGPRPRLQAILPLRGKILNVEKARVEKMLENNEIEALITALGTGIGDDFDIGKLRYDRIIIMTDADVDGGHIRTLLLTFFFRHMRELIEAGTSSSPSRRSTKSSTARRTGTSRKKPPGVPPRRVALPLRDHRRRVPAVLLADEELAALQLALEQARVSSRAARRALHGAVDASSRRAHPQRAR